MGLVVVCLVVCVAFCMLLPNVTLKARYGLDFVTLG